MQKRECDVLIIGGGPAGSVCAMTAKMNFPTKEILVVREQELQMIPCAIPYIFSETLGCVENNLVSCAPAQQFGISTLIGRVESVDTEKKIASMTGYEISFEKLVFATGSKPFVHPALSDSQHLKGVFTVPKNVPYISEMLAYTKDKKSVAVVGTGFIGIEMAMELAQSGKEVTLIGRSKHILKGSFDSDVAMMAEAIIRSEKINYMGCEEVGEMLQKDSAVCGIKLQSGILIDTDMVVLATGFKANTDLAEKAHMKFGHYGGIWVDEYMRTENHDIFAVGDCAMRRHFITKEQSKVMLASTSSAEGRVAGSSLYGVKYLKHFSGTIAIFSTVIGDRAFASAGITYEEAKNGHADVVMGAFEGTNRHPAAIPDAKKQYVKLIAMRNGGQIIGGQIVGGEEAGEMINLVGIMIEKGMTIYEAMTMQVATQPKLTASPTMYPLTIAATMIAQEISKGCEL